MKLTARQQKFINEYLKSGNATDAATKAGYSKKTARAMGAENLTKPNIQKSIAERQSKAATKADVSLTWWVEKTKRIAEKSKRDSDKVRALDLLGKHLGAYREDNQMSIDFKALPDSQLNEIIEKLKTK